MVRPFSLRPKITRDHAAALVVTLLSPLLYFFPATAGRIVLCPDDGIIFNVPLRVAAAQLMRDGYLPLWNPYIFGGMPLYGAAQAGILFPLNWFYLLFSAPAATNLMVLGTYALAALGAYLYARRSGASVTGALVTSLVWQWSGFLVAQLGHINIIQTAALLPWLLWAIDGYGATGERRKGALLAALVALQFFAGHQQTFVYSILLAAAYALWMMRMMRTEKSKRRAYLMSLVFMAGGLLLAAVQILPTLELMRHSLRASASYDFFTSFSLPPRFLLTFVAPYVGGGGDVQLFRAPYTGAAFYGEYIGYVGIATLMLAALAVVLQRDATTKFWSVVAVVCFVLALGRFAPLNFYKLIYYIPVINLFRVPARHLLEVDFALAVLAGRAITVIPALRDRLRTRLSVLGVGTCAVVLTCLTVTVGRPAEFRLGREAPVTLLRAPELFMPIVVAALSAWAIWSFTRGRRRNAAVLLITVIAFDLNLWGQSSGWRHSPTLDDALWREPAAVKFLREREATTGQRQQMMMTDTPYRILTVPQAFTFADSTTTSNLAANEFVLSLQPDIYMMHGIENAAGYDGFGLARYSRLAGEMKIWGDLSDAPRSLGQSREFDLLNVRYLLTRSGQPTSTDASKQAATQPVALPAPQTFGGYAFAAEDLNAPYLDRGKRIFFTVPRVAADHIALLTNLSWSLDVPDGETIGRVRLHTTEGRTFDFALRAGEHTSEWAYDRPDIKRRIRHKRAPIATSYTVEDAESRYEGHTFVAAFALPEKAIITDGEIEVASVAAAPDLGINVQRVSLSDKSTDAVVPLRPEWLSKASANVAEAEGQTGVERWQRAGEAENVRIYENTRVLPRAWLAGEAVSASDESALEVIRTGRLPDGRQWNPLETVLVEASLDTVNAVGAAGTETAAREAQFKSYEPNRIEVSVSSKAASVLVLSENHYPGWRARVDGRNVETLRVNYNLRGVAVPAGDHQIEFVYRPKSLLVGLLVSLLAAAVLLIWMSRR